LNYSHGTGLTRSRARRSCGASLSSPPAHYDSHHQTSALHQLLLPVHLASMAGDSAGTCPAAPRTLCGSRAQVRCSTSARSSYPRIACLPCRRSTPCSPARPFPSSIFLDKNRRDIGKSQSIWTDSKMETAGSHTPSTAVPLGSHMYLAPTLSAHRPWHLTRGARRGSGAHRPPLEQLNHTPECVKRSEAQ
jgi:hypothetical protein